MKYIYEIDAVFDDSEFKPFIDRAHELAIEPTFLKQKYNASDYEVRLASDNYGDLMIFILEFFGHESYELAIDELKA